VTINSDDNVLVLVALTALQCQHISIATSGNEIPPANCSLLTSRSSRQTSHVAVIVILT